MQTEYLFNWKEIYIDKLKTQEAIINDCLLEDHESIFFEFAKDDIKKILTKCNYKFILEYDLFDELYGKIIHITQRQLKRVIKDESRFVHFEMKCLDIIDKIISRSANNFKNIFDDRYNDSVFINKYNYINDPIDLNDALSILLADKDEENVTAMDLKMKALAVRKASQIICKELIERAKDL